MTLVKTLIPAPILLFGWGWTMAEEESAETLPRFSQVDTDQDGGFSKTEAEAVPGLVEVFAQGDINADGWLNENEYIAVEQALRGERGTFLSPGPHGDLKKEPARLGVQEAPRGHPVASATERSLERKGWSAQLQPEILTDEPGGGLYPSGSCEAISMRMEGNGERKGLVVSQFRSFQGSRACLQGYEQSARVVGLIMASA